MASKDPPVVYVAGPIGSGQTWEREQNIRRAETLALEAWMAGAAVICVHSAGRFYSEKCGVDWLHGDFAILKKCDAVLMTADWKASLGAVKEQALAVKEGIKVLYSISELKEFLLDWNYAS
jgi:hypothetical protein